MKKLLPLLAAVASVAGAALPATGAEIEGNVTLTSDYSFRGWSQTMRDPAIQGGFDVAFDSGFRIGTWASNVNFCPRVLDANGDGVDMCNGVVPPDVVVGTVEGGTSMEWDLYVGWSKELSEGVALDLSFIYFDYPGDRDALNYQEYAASLAIADFTLGVNYSPEYLAAADVTFIYPYLDYSYGISDDVSLDLHLGFNLADSPDGDFFGAEGDDYMDYSASVSFPMAGITVSFGLYGTNNSDCGRDCEFRPILSLSR